MPVPTPTLDEDPDLKAAAVHFAELMIQLAQPPRTEERDAAIRQAKIDFDDLTHKMSAEKRKAVYRELSALLNQRIEARVIRKHRGPDWPFGPP